MSEQEKQQDNFEQLIEDIGNHLSTREHDMIESAKNWFSILDGVKYEDWNDELKSHSINRFRLPLTQKQVKVLCQAEEDVDNEIGEIEYQITKRIMTIGDDNVFVKLTSRSPKDWLVQDDGNQKPLHNYNDILTALGCSLRTLEDLYMFSRLPDNTCSIWLSKFEDIDVKNEWRCYVKDGEIIGVSQYNYFTTYDYSPQYLEYVQNEIKEMFDTVLKQNMNVKDYVVDFVIPEQPFKKTLILETNPYGWSDPCLFLGYAELESAEDKFLWRA